jgi:hypothetical protein
MSSIKRATAAKAVVVNFTNVEIDGAWMPCEYVQDLAGKVRVVMLADIEFDEPARRFVWHMTVDEAAYDRYQAIEPCRKLAVRMPLPGRSIEDCPFRQSLKRDLVGRAA